MLWTEQALPGVFVLDAQPHADERGSLRRQFCRREFEQHGVVADVMQCNMSENSRKHTLRGFHYQAAPHGEAKTISCVRGAVHDIVVDMRPESKTYMKWISVELTADNRKSLHVPAGCANAWLTLADDTWVYYLHSGFYAPEAERGVRYDDPLFKFRWPAEPAVISDKDRRIPDYVDKKR
jgi:dTDP-4-dehydrorhamnose 3,5-epimerase